MQGPTLLGSAERLVCQGHDPRGDLLWNEVPGARRDVDPQVRRVRFPSGQHRPTGHWIDFADEQPGRHEQALLAVSAQQRELAGEERSGLPVSRFPVRPRWLGDRRPGHDTLATAGLIAVGATGGPSQAAADCHHRSKILPTSSSPVAHVPIDVGPLR